MGLRCVVYSDPDCFFWPSLKFFGARPMTNEQQAALVEAVARVIDNHADKIYSLLEYGPTSENINTIKNAAQAAIAAHEKFLADNGMVIVPRDLLERTITMRDDFWEDDVRAMLAASEGEG